METTTLTREQRRNLRSAYTEHTADAEAFLNEGDVKRANRSQGAADGIVQAMSLITGTDAGALYAQFMED
jgi:hypothetical protein